MKRFLSSLIIILLSSSSLGQTDLTYWGSSHYFQRYSPAAQINSDNVSFQVKLSGADRLERASEKRSH